MKNKLISTFILLSFSIAMFSQSAIYVCGHFRRERTHTVADLKVSGYNTAILFNVHIEANGDLSTDRGGEAGGYICQNGQYVFGNVQPHYINDVNSLLEGNTSIKRIEHCVGGWGNSSYDNVKSLVNSYGGTISTSSNLYKNWKALHDALPCVEAINNDQEQCYDVATAVEFHKMLFDIGFKTTVAPYTQKTYWTNFVSQLNSARAGAVDRIYIQCYDGGRNNNPADWYLGTNIPIWSGQLTYEETNDEKKTKFEKWKLNSRVEGGFYWNYNDNSRNLQGDAKIINDIYKTLAPFVIVYKTTNYVGAAYNFEATKYSTHDISLQRLSPNDIRSVKVREGFKITLYGEDNQTGASLTLENNTPTFSDLARPTTVKSWEITANGDTSLTGKTFYLKNKKSGLYLTPNGTTGNAAITQLAFSGENMQKWYFAHQGNGVYLIKNEQTRRYLQIENVYSNNAARYSQNTNQNLPKQKHVAVANAENGTYRFLTMHNAQYLATASDLSDALIVQNNDDTNEATEWYAEDITAGTEELKIENEKLRIFVENEQLIINNEQLLGNEEIKIYDIMGHIVVKRKCLFTTKEATNISHLPEGVYIVRIGNKSAKFIKLCESGVKYLRNRGKR